MWPLDPKTSLKSLGYICSIAKNTLYGSKWLIFHLCQKILMILSKDHVPWRYIYSEFSTVNISTSFLISKMHCEGLNLDNIKRDFYYFYYDIYSAFRWCINLNFEKLTHMSGFVVQGLICWSWILKVFLRMSACLFHLSNLGSCFQMAD